MSSGPISEVVKANKFVVCGENFWPYVRKTIETLESQKIPHVYHSGMSDDERKELAGIVGKTSVPQGFVNTVAIGGCNDGPKPWQGILPLLRSGKLQRAMEIDDPEETQKILMG